MKGSHCLMLFVTMLFLAGYTTCMPSPPRYPPAYQWTINWELPAYGQVGVKEIYVDSPTMRWHENMTWTGSAQQFQWFGSKKNQIVFRHGPEDSEPITCIVALSQAVWTQDMLKQWEGVYVGQEYVNTTVSGENELKLTDHWRGQLDLAFLGGLVVIDMWLDHDEALKGAAFPYKWIVDATSVKGSVETLYTVAFVPGTPPDDVFQPPTLWISECT